MNLEKRTERLRLFLSMEKDKDFMQKLNRWHIELMDDYISGKADGGQEQAGELLLKHFPSLKTNKELITKLKSTLELISVFENIAVEEDGLDYVEAAIIVQEILNDLAK